MLKFVIIMFGKEILKYYIGKLTDQKTRGHQCVPKSHRDCIQGIVLELIP